MFIILSVIFVVCLLTRSIIDYVLVKRYNITLENKHSLWVIILMFLLWTSWFLLVEKDPSSSVYPDYLRITGFVLSSIAGILFFGTIIQLRGFRGPNKLISNGLFKYFRHPMYLGFILILIGYPLVHSACYAFLLSFPGIAAVLFWRFCEEKVLMEQYSEYKRYAKMTFF